MPHIDEPFELRNPSTGARVCGYRIFGTPRDVFCVRLYDKGSRNPRYTEMREYKRDAMILGAELLGLRPCWVMVDRSERFNTKRGWFANAYRLVDASGADVVQPWPETRADAKRTASALGFCIVGEYESLRVSLAKIGA